jgi:hypothetical protein
VSRTPRLLIFVLLACAPTLEPERATAVVRSPLMRPPGVRVDQANAAVDDGPKTGAALAVLPDQTALAVWTDAFCNVSGAQLQWPSGAYLHPVSFGTVSVPRRR